MLTPLPPTPCQWARKAVSIQLDGELSELGSARLSAHLRECEACTAYALDLAALTTRLRMAPLEQPELDVVLPSRRRPALRLAAAGAAVAAAVVASLALGHAFSSQGNGAGTNPTATIDLPSLHADIVNQHVLAMLRKLPPAHELRLGRVVML